MRRILASAAALSLGALLFAPAAQAVDAARRKVVESALSSDIPVGNPTDAQLDQFLVLVRDKANMPMLIHCNGALRVGAFCQRSSLLEVRPQRV